MNQKKQNHQVVHQELALDAYLKTLLEDIPDNGREILKDAGKKIPKVKAQALGKVEIAEKPSLQVVEQSLEKVKIASKQLQISNLQTETKLHPLSVMPDWSQYEFQALFFRVDQLILATPLTDLLRTIKIERKPTKIPRQPSWFMGLLDEHDCRIGVLDTGQLVFGKKRGGLRNLEKNPYKSVLITHDSKWGLACDEVLSISKLKPETVRWRTMREKRPWLIGTVIEELTAVIDVQHLVPHRRTE